MRDSKLSHGTESHQALTTFIMPKPKDLVTPLVGASQTNDARDENHPYDSTSLSLSLISLAPRQERDAEPDTFSDKIDKEFVESSAIARCLYEAAIEIVEDTGRFEPNYALGQPVRHFYQRRKPHGFGAVALLKNEDGSSWQGKPQNPRTDKKGKAQKYESIQGQGSRAFLPIIPPEIRRLISQRYSIEVPEFGSFWAWLEQHPEIPIIITEGGKKALALLSQGYVAIALFGCRAGVLVNDTIAGEKVRKLKPELIADLKRFAVRGRKITIAFDQDESFKTRRDIEAATDVLGFNLRLAGCEVSIAQWSQSQGKGVDDLIVNCGPQAWEKAYSEAVSFSEWSITRQLAREVRRKPELNIGDREFVEVASELPGEGTLGLYGNKGSGKSKAIGELLKGQKWISVTNLTSLGRDQAASWKGVFVNDGDRWGTQLMKDGLPVDGGSVCIPSLLKVEKIEADVLVLDEISAVLEFLLGSKLANKEGIRPLLIDEFIRRVRDARLVLIADADLTEEALQYIEAIRGERAYLVKSERKALTYEATIIDAPVKAAIALLQERIEEKPEGKIIYINCDSKALGEALAEVLGAKQSLVINSATSGDEFQAALLASKGKALPSLIAQGIRFIISSPSVVQGFSFEHHTDLIDSVWGFYSGCSIAAHSIAQAPDRVRDSSVPRFFSISNQGCAYSRLSRAQSVATFLKEFKQLNTTAARLVASSLAPDMRDISDRMDWQSQNLRMLASIEVRRNRGMSALRDTVIALLKREGKRVSVVNPGFSKEELQEVSAAMKAAYEVVKNRHCQAVAEAATIDKEEAEKLSVQSDSLKPEEVLSLEKFYLSEFYRLEEVSPKDVAFDRKGRTRSEIKNLEAVLTPDVAIQKTAFSINRDGDCPQDWDAIAVKVWLLEQSGAADLIRKIVAGEVFTLDSELVAPIAEFIRQHSAEFRIAFHFGNVAKLPDQQIIGEVLTRHGIKKKRHGKGENQRYEIQKAELEEVLAIVERRNKEVTPPKDLEVNVGGATLETLDPWAAWKTPEQLENLRELWSICQSYPDQAAAITAGVPKEVLAWALEEVAA